MSWFSRTKNAMNSRRVEAEIAEELRDHLERHAAALRGSGMAPEEAQRQAERRFGNQVRLREQTREARVWPALEACLQDARYALRAIRKNPVFAGALILSLALAIGANTAIFSLVDAAILRPLPVDTPGELFTLTSPGIATEGAEPEPEREFFSYPLYRNFRAAAGASARLALFSPAGRDYVQIAGSGDATERVTRQFVSGDAFDILGVPPAFGRVLSPEDDTAPGAHAVAVLSYEYWTRRFHRDPSVLRQALTVNGTRFSIAGVAREGFFGVEPGKFTDVWVPATMYDRSALTSIGWAWLRIVGRLSPGVTPEQLQTPLQPSFHDFQQQRIEDIPTMPETVRRQFLNAAIQVQPAANGVSSFRQTFSWPLWIVFSVALGTLLIAAANAASLLLARSASRAKEIAVRISIGAGRGRVARQLMTESIVFALLSGALGWAIACVAAPLLAGALSTDGNPLRFTLALTTRALLFCVSSSFCTALFFGLAPALQSSGAQPMRALRGTSGPAGRLRLGRFFVGMQVAFAFSLVVAGGAFLFTLHNLTAVNAGFIPHDVTVFRVASKQTAPAALFNLRSRLAAQPGVQSAALAPWSIFEGSSWSEQVLIAGRAPSEREELMYSVSPKFFATLKIPLLAGRDFAEQDAGAGAEKPAIVNMAFARKYFAGDAVGKGFRYPSGKVPARVVGVVANSSYESLRAFSEPIAYFPMDKANGFVIYVRSALTAGAILQLVDRETRALEPQAKIRETIALETMVGNTILREKLLAGLGGAFALLGLILAAVGLFGILNYSVERRTREIGIRSALGARRDQILGLVLRETLLLVGGGMTAGIAGALAAMGYFQPLLFGVKPVDPWVIGAAAALFLLVATVSGGLPARRAASVDPVIALRSE